MPIQLFKLPALFSGNKIDDLKYLPEESPAAGINDGDATQSTPLLNSGQAVTRLSAFLHIRNRLERDQPVLFDRINQQIEELSSVKWDTADYATVERSSVRTHQDPNSRPNIQVTIDRELDDDCAETSRIKSGRDAARQHLQAVVASDEGAELREGELAASLSNYKHHIERIHAVLNDISLSLDIRASRHETLEKAIRYRAEIDELTTAINTNLKRIAGLEKRQAPPERNLLGIARENPEVTRLKKENESKQKAINGLKAEIGRENGLFERIKRLSMNFHLQVRDGSYNLKRNMGEADNVRGALSRHLYLFPQGLEKLELNPARYMHITAEALHQHYSKLSALRENINRLQAEINRKYVRRWLFSSRFSPEEMRHIDNELEEYKKYLTNQLYEVLYEMRMRLEAASCAMKVRRGEVYYFDDTALHFATKAHGTQFVYSVRGDHTVNPSDIDVLSLDRIDQEVVTKIENNDLTTKDKAYVVKSRFSLSEAHLRKFRRAICNFIDEKDVHTEQFQHNERAEQLMPARALVDQQLNFYGLSLGKLFGLDRDNAVEAAKLEEIDWLMRRYPAIASCLNSPVFRLIFSFRDGGALSYEQNVDDLLKQYVGNGSLLVEEGDKKQFLFDSLFEIACEQLEAATERSGWQQFKDAFSRRARHSRRALFDNLKSHFFQPLSENGKSSIRKNLDYCKKKAVDSIYSQLKHDVNGFWANELPQIYRDTQRAEAESDRVYNEKIKIRFDRIYQRVEYVSDLVEATHANGSEELDIFEPVLEQIFDMVQRTPPARLEELVRKRQPIKAVRRGVQTVKDYLLNGTVLDNNQRLKDRVTSSAATLENILSLADGHSDAFEKFADIDDLGKFDELEAEVAAVYASLARVSRDGGIDDQAQKQAAREFLVTLATVFVYFEVEDQLGFDNSNITEDKLKQNLDKFDLDLGKVYFLLRYDQEQKYGIKIRQRLTSLVKLASGPTAANQFFDAYFFDISKNQLDPSHAAHGYRKNILLHKGGGVGVKDDPKIFEYRNFNDLEVNSSINVLRLYAIVAEQEDERDGFVRLINGYKRKAEEIIVETINYFAEHYYSKAESERKQHEAYLPLFHHRLIRQLAPVSKLSYALEHFKFIVASRNKGDAALIQTLVAVPDDPKNRSSLYYANEMFEHCRSIETGFSAAHLQLGQTTTGSFQQHVDAILSAQIDKGVLCDDSLTSIDVSLIALVFKYASYPVQMKLHVKFLQDLYRAKLSDKRAVLLEYKAIFTNPSLLSASSYRSLQQVGKETLRDLLTADVNDIREHVEREGVGSDKQLKERLNRFDTSNLVLFKHFGDEERNEDEGVGSSLPLAYHQAVFSFVADAKQVVNGNLPDRFVADSGYQREARVRQTAFMRDYYFGRNDTTVFELFIDLLARRLRGSEFIPGELSEDTGDLVFMDLYIHFFAIEAKAYNKTALSYPTYNDSFAYHGRTDFSAKFSQKYQKLFQVKHQLQKEFFGRTREQLAIGVSRSTQVGYRDKIKAVFNAFLTNNTEIEAEALRHLELMLVAMLGRVISGEVSQIGSAEDLGGAQASDNGELLKQISVKLKRLSDLPRFLIEVTEEKMAMLQDAEARGKINGVKCRLEKYASQLDMLANGKVFFVNGLSIVDADTVISGASHRTRTMAPSRRSAALSHALDADNGEAGVTTVAEKTIRDEFHFLFNNAIFSVLTIDFAKALLLYISPKYSKGQFENIIDRLNALLTQMKIEAPQAVPYIKVLTNFIRFLTINANSNIEGEEFIYDDVDIEYMMHFHQFHESVNGMLCKLWMRKPKDEIFSAPRSADQHSLLTSAAMANVSSRSLAHNERFSEDLWPVACQLATDSTVFIDDEKLQVFCYKYFANDGPDEKFKQLQAIAKSGGIAKQVETIRTNIDASDFTSAASALHEMLDQYQSASEALDYAIESIFFAFNAKLQEIYAVVVSGGERRKKAVLKECALDGLGRLLEVFKNKQAIIGQSDLHNNQQQLHDLLFQLFFDLSGQFMGLISQKSDKNDYEVFSLVYKFFSLLATHCEQQWLKSNLIDFMRSHILMEKARGVNNTDIVRALLRNNVFSSDDVTMLQGVYENGSQEEYAVCEYACSYLTVTDVRALTSQLMMLIGDGALPGINREFVGKMIGFALVSDNFTQQYMPIDLFLEVPFGDDVASSRYEFVFYLIKLMLCVFHCSSLPARDSAQNTYLDSGIESMSVDSQTMEKIYHYFAMMQKCDVDFMQNPVVARILRKLNLTTLQEKNPHEAAPHMLARLRQIIEIARDQTKRVIRREMRRETNFLRRLRQPQFEVVTEIEQRKSEDRFVTLEPYIIKLQYVYHLIVKGLLRDANDQLLILLNTLDAKNIRLDEVCDYANLSIDKLFEEVDVIVSSIFVGKDELLTLTTFGDMNLADNLIRCLMKNTPCLVELIDRVDSSYAIMRQIDGLVSFENGSEKFESGKLPPIINALRQHFASYYPDDASKNSDCETIVNALREGSLHQAITMLRGMIRTDVQEKLTQSSNEIERLMREARHHFDLCSQVNDSSNGLLSPDQSMSVHSENVDDLLDIVRDLQGIVEDIPLLYAQVVGFFFECEQVIGNYKAMVSSDSADFVQMMSVVNRNFSLIYEAYLGYVDRLPTIGDQLYDRVHNGFLHTQSPLSQEISSAIIESPTYSEFVDGAKSGVDFLQQQLPLRDNDMKILLSIVLSDSKAREIEGYYTHSLQLEACFIRYMLMNRCGDVDYSALSFKQTQRIFNACENVVMAYPNVHGVDYLQHVRSSLLNYFNAFRGKDLSAGLTRQDILAIQRVFFAYKELILRAKNLFGENDAYVKQLGIEYHLYDYLLHRKLFEFAIQQPLDELSAEVADKQYQGIGQILECRVMFYDLHGADGVAISGGNNILLYAEAFRFLSGKLELLNRSENEYREYFNVDELLVSSELLNIQDELKACSQLQFMHLYYYMSIGDFNNCAAALHGVLNLNQIHEVDGHSGYVAIKDATTSIKRSFSLSFIEQICEVFADLFVYLNTDQAVLNNVNIKFVSELLKKALPFLAVLLKQKRALLFSNSFDVNCDANMKEIFLIIQNQISAHEEVAGNDAQEVSIVSKMKTLVDSMSHVIDLYMDSEITTSRMRDLLRGKEQVLEQTLLAINNYIAAISEQKLNSDKLNNSAIEMLQVVVKRTQDTIALIREVVSQINTANAPGGEDALKASLTKLKMLIAGDSNQAEISIANLLQNAVDNFGQRNRAERLFYNVFISLRDKERKEKRLSLLSRVRSALERYNQNERLSPSIIVFRMINNPCVFAGVSVTGSNEGGIGIADILDSSEFSDDANNIAAFIKKVLSDRQLFDEVVNYCDGQKLVAKLAMVVNRLFYQDQLPNLDLLPDAIREYFEISAVPDEVILTHYQFAQIRNVSSEAEKHYRDAVTALNNRVVQQLKLKPASTLHVRAHMVVRSGSQDICLAAILQQVKTLRNVFKIHVEYMKAQLLHYFIQNKFKFQNVTDVVHNKDTIWTLLMRPLTDDVIANLRDQLSVKDVSHFKLPGWMRDILRGVQDINVVKKYIIAVITLSSIYEDVMYLNRQDITAENCFDIMFRVNRSVHSILSMLGTMKKNKVPSTSFAKLVDQTWSGFSTYYKQTAVAIHELLSMTSSHLDDGMRQKLQYEMEDIQGKIDHVDNEIMQVKAIDSERACIVENEYERILDLRRQMAGIENEFASLGENAITGLSNHVLVEYGDHLNYGEMVEASGQPLSTEYEARKSALLTELSHSGYRQFDNEAFRNEYESKLKNYCKLLKEYNITSADFSLALVKSIEAVSANNKGRNEYHADQVDVVLKIHDFKNEFPDFVGCVEPSQYLQVVDQQVEALQDSLIDGLQRLFAGLTNITIAINPSDIIHIAMGDLYRLEKKYIYFDKVSDEDIARDKDNVRDISQQKNDLNRLMVLHESLLRKIVRERGETDRSVLVRDFNLVSTLRCQLIVKFLFTARYLSRAERIGHVEYIVKALQRFVGVLSDLKARHDYVDVGGFELTIEKIKNAILFINDAVTKRSELSALHDVSQFAGVAETVHDAVQLQQSYPFEFYYPDRGSSKLKDRKAQLEAKHRHVVAFADEDQVAHMSQRHNDNMAALDVYINLVDERLPRLNQFINSEQVKRFRKGAETQQRQALDAIYHQLIASDGSLHELLSQFNGASFPTTQLLDAVFDKTNQISTDIQRFIDDQLTAELNQDDNGLLASLLYQCRELQKFMQAITTVMNNIRLNIAKLEARAGIRTHIQMSVAYQLCVKGEGRKILRSASLPVMQCAVQHVMMQIEHQEECALQAVNIDSIVSNISIDVVRQQMELLPLLNQAGTVDDKHIVKRLGILQSWLRAIDIDCVDINNANMILLYHEFNRAEQCWDDRVATHQFSPSLLLHEKMQFVREYISLSLKSNFRQRDLVVAFVQRLRIVREKYKNEYLPQLITGHANAYVYHNLGEHDPHEGVADSVPDSAGKGYLRNELQQATTNDDFANGMLDRSSIANVMQSHLQQERLNTAFASFVESHMSAYVGDVDSGFVEPDFGREFNEQLINLPCVKAMYIDNLQQAHLLDRQPFNTNRFNQRFKANMFIPLRHLFKLSLSAVAIESIDSLGANAWLVDVIFEEFISLLGQSADTDELTRKITIHVRRVSSRFENTNMQLNGGDYNDTDKQSHYRKLVMIDGLFDKFVVNTYAGDPNHLYTAAINAFREAYLTFFAKYADNGDLPSAQQSQQFAEDFAQALAIYRQCKDLKLGLPFEVETDGLVMEPGLQKIIDVLRKVRRVDHYVRLTPDYFAKLVIVLLKAPNTISDEVQKIVIHRFIQSSDEYKNNMTVNNIVDGLVNRVCQVNTFLSNIDLGHYNIVSEFDKHLLVGCLESQQDYGDDRLEELLDSHVSDFAIALCIAKSQLQKLSQQLLESDGTVLHKKDKQLYVSLFVREFVSLQPDDEAMRFFNDRFIKLLHDKQQRTLGQLQAETDAFDQAFSSGESVLAAPAMMQLNMRLLAGSFGSLGAERRVCDLPQIRCFMRAVEGLASNNSFDRLCSAVDAIFEYPTKALEQFTRDKYKHLGHYRFQLDVANIKKDTLTRREGEFDRKVNYKYLQQLLEHLLGEDSEIGKNFPLRKNGESLSIEDLRAGLSDSRTMTADQTPNRSHGGVVSSPARSVPVAGLRSASSRWGMATGSIGVPSTPSMMSGASHWARPNGNASRSHRRAGGGGSAAAAAAAAAAAPRPGAWGGDQS